MKIMAGVFIIALVLIGRFFLSPSELTHSEEAEKGAIVPIGNMISQRFAHTSTLLSNGRILIVGGQDGGALATAEIFDPAFNSFTSTGIMAEARAGHTATLLPSGKVLITGGYNGSYLSTAEV